MTRRFAVVGSPIDHSLSPTLHLAAYRHLGLDYSYEKFDVSAGGLAEFVAENDFDGLSVTMPLKSEAFALGNSIQAESDLTQVANTLVRTTSGFDCYNTDVFGLERALTAIPAAESFVVLGSGATTSSALVALARIFPDSRISIFARNHQARSKQLDFAKSLGLDVLLPQPDAKEILRADLVLSLVPAGSNSDLWDQIQNIGEVARGWLFDVSYNPWPSHPASSWPSERVISGIEMLIWQAIQQVKLFATSKGQLNHFDEESLYEVLKQAVSGK